MEATADKSKCQFAERDYYQKYQHEPYRYATEICKWTVQRKLKLLQIKVQSMAANDPKRMVLLADLNHHKTSEAIIIQKVNLLTISPHPFYFHYILHKYPCTKTKTQNAKHKTQNTQQNTPESTRILSDDRNPTTNDASSSC